MEVQTFMGIMKQFSPLDHHWCYWNPYQLFTVIHDVRTGYGAAAILLLDRRYGTPAIQGKLPGWIRGSLKKGMGVREAVGEMRGFFEHKANPV